ncbi:MAG: hypothetical protein LBS84_01355, partial [Clostridiales bacterium]|nr:hypothetical protein [Clostridiales bacterium]
MANNILLITFILISAVIAIRSISELHSSNTESNNVILNAVDYKAKLEKSMNLMTTASLSSIINIADPERVAANVEKIRSSISAFD